jgi:AcrR family transcriptional regulator
MPKLKLEDVERNQIKIEEAALRVFTRQGYHGTAVREIADSADVSLGNIYNYYANKEEIFASLAKRYGTRMAALQRRMLAPLLVRKMDRTGLRKLAHAVREIVYRNPDYWRLMYIDVVEFGNRHFASSFRDLARNIAAVTGREVQLSVRKNGVNPTFAFSAIYLQFFTYFLVEKLFGGKQHLGLPEEQAIAQLIEIYTAGVRSNGPPKKKARRKGV